MAVISTTIASGAYDATWAVQGTPSPIGLTEGPIRLQQNVNGLPIRATQWADTIIDYILRGAGCFGVIVIKEWTIYTKTFIWPFGTTMGDVDEPGRKFSDYVQQMVLTAQANTPAAALGPVTRTCLPGHNLDIPLWAGPRDIVVAVGVLPQPTGTGSRKARFYIDT
jgi:hypothetical protein